MLKVGDKVIVKKLKNNPSLSYAVGNVYSIGGVNLGDKFPYALADCYFSEDELILVQESYSIEEVISLLREFPHLKFQELNERDGSYITIEDETVVWMGHNQDGQAFHIWFGEDDRWELIIDEDSKHPEVCECCGQVI